MKNPFAVVRDLTGRLSFSKKFAVIGIVLCLPLGYVTNAYVSLQQAQVDFSVAEGNGVVYIKPTTQLLDLLVEQRRLAVAAELTGAQQPAASSKINDSVTAIDAADKQYGKSFESSQQWAALKADIAAATSADFVDAKAAYDAYNKVTEETQGLIVQVGNKSNLILDPDLDSFYLMDLVVNKLPVLVDTTGQAGDLAALAQSKDANVVKQLGDTRVELAVFNGTVNTTFEGVKSGLETAYHNTANAKMKPALDGAFTSLDAVNTKVLASLAAGAAVPDAANAAHSAASLADATSPQLANLLEVRIGKFNAKGHTIEAIAGVGLVIALFLFAAVWASVRRSINAMVRTLDAAAEGDFTHEVEVLTRDELATMGRSLSRTIARMGSALNDIGSSSGSLTSSSEDLAVISRQMAGSAATMAAGTSEMAATIEQIALTATEAHNVTEAAVVEAREANAVIGSLGDSTARIGEVVELITSIAEQTNLLALNATIESARAGDAGKGFAVVAGEVKELAKQTSVATADISESIARVQEDTLRAVDVITRVAAIIEQVSEAQGTIANVVSEQSEATNEIGRSASETASGAGATEHASEALAGMASNLEDVVRRFRYQGSVEGIRPAQHS